MAFTKLEPTGVNTSATFTFANANVTTNLNISGISNLGPVSNVIITGGTTGQVLGTDGSGTLSWVTQSGGGSDYSNANVASYLPTYTGELTAANINASGNITATFLIGDGSQLTGLPASYSNANVATYLPTYTSNVSANYFIGDGSQLTNVAAATAATVTASSQPNITSVGALSGLTVTGTTTLGAPTNVKITGGLANYVLTTDGLGNLSWSAGGGGGGSSGGAGFITVSKDVFTATGSANTYTLSITPSSVAYIVVNIDGVVQQLSSYSLATNIVTIAGMPDAGEIIEVTSYGVGGLPGGSDTQLQFNSSGVFAGSPALTFNSTTSVLTLSGNITTTNANLGNLVTSNYFSGNGSLVTSLNASNISSGTIPSGILGNSTLYVGTTAIALNRASASISLTGVANIPLTKFNETVVSVGATSGTLAPDAAAGTIYKYTLNGATTINGLTNAVAGTSVTIILTQDATGSRLLTSTMKFANGSKTLSTAANSIDVLSVFYDGTTYYASLSKGFA